MTKHEMMRFLAAVTERRVAAAGRTVTTSVASACLARRLAAKPVKIPSPDVRAMRARAAAIAPEPETGDGNGKNKRAWNFPGKINK